MAWTYGQPLAIKTERFIIRTLSPEDINENYVSWWNDPEVQKGFQLPQRNWTLKEARKHVQQFNNEDKLHLGIYLQEGNELIGFFTAVLDPEKRIAVPNICIGNKNYWGKHVATEVGRPFLKLFFERLGVCKVEGHVKGYNLASFAILRHFGFKKEGQLRLKARGIGGEYVDHFVFGLLKEEWLEIQKKDKAEKK